MWLIFLPLWALSFGRRFFESNFWLIGEVVHVVGNNIKSLTIFFLCGVLWFCVFFFFGIRLKNSSHHIKRSFVISLIDSVLSMFFFDFFVFLLWKVVFFSYNLPLHSAQISILQSLKCLEINEPINLFYKMAMKLIVQLIMQNFL